MGFHSAFKGLKLLKKNPRNGRLNNLNDPDRPQCVNMTFVSMNSSLSRHIAIRPGRNISAVDTRRQLEKGAWGSTKGY
jgi:hypothetical protein